MAELIDLEIGTLSEAKTKAAIAARNWPALKAHLDEIGVDDATLDELLGHLRRAGDLILRYSDAKRERRRDEFLENLREYIRASYGEIGAVRVANDMALLIQIQRGYPSILAMLEAADISKLPPESRIAACFGWSLRAYADLMTMQDEAVQNLERLSFQNSVFVSDEEGRPVSVDAGINGIVCAFSTTLVMEAYKNDWKDEPSGVVILPKLLAAGDGDIIKASATGGLAMCWAQWQRTEERRRFLGGVLEEFTAVNLPAWTPNDATVATEYTPEEMEFYDYAANERLMDRLGQQFMQMMVETNAPNKVSGIANPVPLVPTGFVSLEEMHAAASLSDILKYE